MNILISFDKFYTKPTAVMVRSLIKKTSKMVPLYFYIAKFKDSENVDLSFFKKTLRKIDRFQILEIDKHLPSSLLGNLFPYPEEIMLKIFSMFYLDKKIDKILWIDGDIVINHNIEEFYNETEISKFAIKGIAEKGESIYELLKCVNYDQQYLNVGFLLMNPSWFQKKWHNIETFFNEISSISFSKKRHIAYEQDLLNFLCSEQKISLNDPYYNYSAYTKKEKDKYNFFKMPAVIHYAGVKPWNFFTTKSKFFFTFWFNSFGVYNIKDFFHCIKETIRRVMLK